MCFLLVLQSGAPIPMSFYIRCYKLAKCLTLSVPSVSWDYLKYVVPSISSFELLPYRLLLLMCSHKHTALNLVDFLKYYYRRRTKKYVYNLHVSDLSFSCVLHTSLPFPLLE